MSRQIHNREQALAYLLSLTPEEAHTYARRTAEIAQKHNDLGIGMRTALAEIVDARTRH